LSKLELDLKTSAVAEELSAYCERDFTPLVESLDLMRNILLTMGDALLDTIELLGCSNIVPIYQNSVYSGSCDYSIKAVMWLFSSSLVMAFFGFLMLTFRSALYDTEYTHTYDSNYGRSSAFHDENDDDNNQRYDNGGGDDDGQTRAGATVAADSVMQSVVNYENSYLNGSANGKK
jgi:hypothetical protein